MPLIDTNVVLQVRDSTTLVERPLSTDDLHLNTDEHAALVGVGQDSTLQDLLAAVSLLSPAGTFNVTAGANLSGHRVVKPQIDDTVVYADNTVLGDMNLPAYLTTGAIVLNASGPAVYLGRVVEPSWTWTPGQPVYLGASGNLTQTVPTFAGGARFLLQVALATAATELFFNPKMPVILS